jgi:preprotein translocase subunit SecG
MYVALTIVHILVALIMVGVILLQSGKGAEIGAAFGGSSQTVFGSRGASSFLSKMTAVAAAIFMISSLTLAILSKRQNYASTLGLDKPTPGQSAPAAPSAPALPAPTQPMTDQHPHDSSSPAPAAPAQPAPAPGTP